ncbi:hypothetical protein EYF80_034667 [Liparis tanakae]|uniref:Uncharacterized protein n=1 Tax=Liparis tanakae TaxID=230148 RepID=A0A4Z2GQU6_9TELE|nr:hypothetical protein EYF80_034667 [Liparis tanakae]
MASTSPLVTSSVLRLPMKTRELRERGSVLLVTLLLAIGLPVRVAGGLPARLSLLEEKKKRGVSRNGARIKGQLQNSHHQGGHTWGPIAVLLRARGRVASRLRLDSLVLSTSSSLRCSSSSWRNGANDEYIGTCVAAGGRFLPAAAALGLPAAPLARSSLSLCSRTACRVLRYSREKLLMVLQKSSAWVSLAVARE